MVPDVTVVVPVYNTMPYLTRCLDSLVDQTIGVGRMHVVAVDDGSTDGSGKELDKYADRHPGLFTVVHQANSGGPAAPCNRGLELATGRFVFFLGADDYLADEALERLVARADEWDSDVVFGRMVGVGGRGVSQRLFRGLRPDVPFPASDLVFALANTKLFRRSLLEEHGIRYSRDLRVGSDQPFAIEAMLHARRISVLGDATYYYAVRRHDAGNITFSSDWSARVRDIGTVMDHVAEIVPPGEKRDLILRRHFTWELGNRLRHDLLDLPEDEQQRLCEAVRALADRYLTPGLSRRLPVGVRLLVRLAQAGRADLLRAHARFHRDGRHATLLLDGPRVRLVLPGFGELPDEWFEPTMEKLWKLVESSVDRAEVSFEGPHLLVSATTRLDPAAATQVHARLVPLGRGKRPRPLRELRSAPAEGPALVTAPVAVEPDDAGNRLTARLPLARLLGDAEARPHRRWALRLLVEAGGRTFDVPVTAAGPAVAQVRVGTRHYRLTARRDPERRVVVRRTLVPFRDALRGRVRGGQ